MAAAKWIAASLAAQTRCRPAAVPLSFLSYHYLDHWRLYPPSLLASECRRRVHAVVSVQGRVRLSRQRQSFGRLRVDRQLCQYCSFASFYLYHKVSSCLGDTYCADCLAIGCPAPTPGQPVQPPPPT